MKIQKSLRSIWNEFVYGGHLWSLGAVSIVYTSAVLLDINITWDFLVIVYLGTYSSYLYNRYKEFDRDFLTNPIRTKHIKNYIKYIPLILFSALLMIVGVSVYFDKISALLFIFLLLLLGFSYSVIFKRISKKIPGFKNYYISLSFALLVILMSIYYSLPLTTASFLIMLFIYLRLFVNTTFFDNKDIESDKKEALLTLPIVLGRSRLFYVLNFASFLAIGALLVGFDLSRFPTSSLMLLFTVPYTYCYIRKSQDQKTDSTFLYNVIVDGEFVLWSVFVSLGRLFLR